MRVLEVVSDADAIARILHGGDAFDLPRDRGPVPPPRERLGCIE